MRLTSASYSSCCYSSDPTRLQSPLSLNNLPLELLVMVLCYVFQAPSDIIELLRTRIIQSSMDNRLFIGQYNIQPWDADHGSPKVAEINLSILRTCRKFNYLGKKLFWGLNTVVLELYLTAMQCHWNFSKEGCVVHLPVSI